MKRLILSFVALLAVAITFTACNSNSPKATADKFLTSLSHMDYEGAKSVSTEETKKMIELISSFSSMMPDSVKAEAKKIKITIKDEKIEGDNATVTYTSSEDENKTEKKLNLTKKDGKWLVVWNKDEGMGAGGEEHTTEPAPEEEAMDTTMAPPADAMPSDSAVK